MDKLIITITSDSTMSYPSNPHNATPKGIDEVAREYVRSIDAGAAISHLHGPYTQDKEIQPDGTRLSDLDRTWSQCATTHMMNASITNPGTRLWNSMAFTTARN